ncbi:MAG: LCP family protein [Chloroflexi bacterium]|nr:LCP family protein [Chloroflexota bacterium]
MTDNYNTEPMYPSSPHQQGKLVLGQTQRPQRRPYQYQAQQPTQLAQPPALAPQRAQSGRPRSLPRLQAKRRKRGGRGRVLVAVLVVLILLGVIITTTQRVLAFGSAISTQPPLSTQTLYMNTLDRVNLLVMGYGGGTHDGANLTDSMLVMSLLPLSHHTSLISVPRDLWIQYPPNSGQFAKLNTVYQSGSNNGQNPQAGGDAAAQKVSLITGLDVRYWMTINFTGFRELINSIGGINVYVPDSFNACYPKNDDANVDASWIKVQFNKGMQHMDGETAIRYARAREPLDTCGMGTSENLAELTDFGRSARQQIIIKAVLAQIKQISTWPKLLDATTALQHTIYTNLSLADLAEFSSKMDLNDAHTAHIGLSNDNVLQDQTSNDGQQILLPQNNNWQAIVDYIQQNLYN